MLAWFTTFYARNHTFLLQAFLIALITDQLFFKEESIPKRIGKSLGAFLLSLNTSMIMTVFLYQKLSPLLSLNVLSDFFLATGLILLTLIPVIFLYQRLINKKPSVAVFTYCQFVIAAEISSLLANQNWQWDFFTIILTLCLYFLFKKEIRYISQEQTVITEDSRFFWSTVLCIILVVAQAEFPRMFLNGSNSAVPTPIAYVVSFLAIISCIMYVVFMKFNIFSVTRYESYLKKYDDDQLTGAKSLHYFMEHYEESLKQFDKKKELTIFYSSLVNLHDYNLTNGYQDGSNLLKFICQQLQEQFPKSIISRNGAHFIGIIEKQDEDNFSKIIKAVAARSTGETLLFKVGLAPFKPSRHLLRRQRNTELLHGLDQAASAFHSIKLKNASIGYYDDQLAKADEIRVHVLSEIDQACRDNWLKIYYQPLIDIQTMKLAECEALSRWIDPKYGFLSPDKFIPALEANREVYKVDCHVLEGYGQDDEFLRKKEKEIFPISFNISRTDLEACDIYQKIEDTIARYGLSRDQVHIEITESALNDNSQAMVEAVQHFHDLGYQVWMDDFGSGYSSLNVLKDYHFDVIKIDMVFLRKFDDRSKTIVRNICRMAKELGIRTVCEGVETQEQFDFLKEAGCNLAQGFLFSPPVPLDELYKKMAPYL